MIRDVFDDRANVEVDTFDGLLVDYAPPQAARMRSSAACGPSPTSSTSFRWR